MPRAKARRFIRINEPIIERDDIEAVTEVLESGILTDKMGMGPYVTKFEQEFAKFVGTKYAIATNSGTSALLAALSALGIKQGDEVILPSFAFVAAAEAVVWTGATPVFADIDLSTYTIDPDSIKECITPNTKAIIVVHLYGMPADMDPIMEIAEEHGLYVIEDAAQAHGAKYKGKVVGSIGHVGCFSFYATKIITTGEGGMVVTNDKELADKIFAIRNHGETSPYRSFYLGLNLRMTEIQAALGLSQLRKIRKFLKKRRENARKLTKEIGGMAPIIVPVVPKDRKHSWYVYTIRIRTRSGKVRDKIVQKLKEKGIDARVYYSRPIHLMPYYTVYKTKPLRKTKLATKQVICLPVHPRVEDRDIKYMAESVKKLVRKYV